MINRNFITNILGAALTAWTGNQAITGKLTVNQLMLAVPTAIVSFATGAKDSKLAELERRLSPSDRAAMKGVGEIVLNQIANRFGYRVTSNDLVNPVAGGRADGLGRGPVGTVRDQRDRGGDVGLDAGLLEGMANDGDYGDRGIDNLRNSSIAPPETIRSQAWRAADIARGKKPIDGTDIYPSQYIRESMAGDADDNSYSLPVQEGSGEWRN